MNTEERLENIEKILTDMQKQGNWINAIQLGALVLVFAFGIVTFKDLKKAIK